MALLYCTEDHPYVSVFVGKMFKIICFFLSERLAQKGLENTAHTIDDLRNLACVRLQ